MRMHWTVAVVVPLALQKYLHFPTSYVRHLVCQPFKRISWRFFYFFYFLLKFVSFFHSCPGKEKINEKVVFVSIKKSSQAEVFFFFFDI